MPHGPHCSWAAFEEKNVKSKKEKKGGRREEINKKKCFKIRELLQILEPDNIQRSQFKKSLMKGLSSACKCPLLNPFDSLSPSADWNNTSYSD